MAAATMAVALLPVVAGCGRGQSYCDVVRDHQSELGTIAGGDDRAGLITALPIFRDLRDHAPDDVADDWDVVMTRLEDLADALTDAHVDPATYDPRHPPAGLDDQDREAIRRAAARLAATDTQEALASVQQEVLDVCHTPLEL
ncbi:MAG TPA: hypothetical protein VFM08_10155 [Nocardioides sp.]|nr:hypothetical protein [Nocardioides sp.]